MTLHISVLISLFSSCLVGVGISVININNHNMQISVHLYEASYDLYCLFHCQPCDNLTSNLHIREVMVAQVDPCRQDCQACDWPKTFQLHKILCRDFMLVNWIQLQDFKWASWISYWLGEKSSLIASVFKFKQKVEFGLK